MRFRCMHNNSPTPQKNTNEWTVIEKNFKAAGFTVSYECISDDPTNPLWRANAVRFGKEWSALGKSLEAAIVGLEEQTQESSGGYAI